MLRASINGKKSLPLTALTKENVYNFKILNSFSDGVEEEVRIVLTQF